MFFFFPLLVLDDMEVLYWLLHFVSHKLRVLYLPLHLWSYDWHNVWCKYLQRSWCISLRNLMQSCFYPEYTKIQLQQIWRVVLLLWRMISKEGLNRENNWLKTILTALSHAKPQLMVCIHFMSLVMVLSFNVHNWT